MDQDRETGAARPAPGQAQGAAGKPTGGPKAQGEARGRGSEGTVESLVGQASETVRQVAGQASETVRQVADQAAEVGHDMYERGRRYVDEGRRRYPEAERYYREGTRAVSHQVEESPLLAIAIAGAVGYALAWLIHGRR